jgi:hypothetical protein
MLTISRRLFSGTNTRALSLTSIARNNTSTASKKAPRTLSDGEKTIYDKLSAKFEPSQLQVQDVSGIHVSQMYFILVPQF